MAVVTNTIDNIFTSVKPIITVNDLQLEAGQNVVRGQVLKKGTTGLIALTSVEYVEADASSVTHIETSTSTDLVQGDLIYNIAQVQMYQYVGANANAVNLSTADYTNGGLYQKVSKLDTPYCISMENINATAGAKNITYSYDCSVLNSELTYAVGTIADFRDKFAETSILVQE